MERIIYDRMAELDERHWWYRARRKVLASLIARKIALPRDAHILEIGCGTGHNVLMLRQFGAVDAVEIDDDARAVASKRLNIAVGNAPLPELPGVAEGAYDLIALLDVLEHVDADRDALISIARRLKPGGKLLLTVPAHPWMWSAHDVANHHKRRYTKKTLSDVVQAAGLRIETMSYFNSILFPLAAAVRIKDRLTGKEGSDDALPPSPINSLFETLFGLEAYAIGRLPFTPGVSIGAVVSAT
ncbi:class I SAM-dependent methyltransferase [Allosphingosinicella vermicomposti]|uniref:class I SAM-dependent methyltransferase n=1 Tax=Allosphingosinicella vermicomposti TaxID=614671 RepID=UPI000D10ABBE|nr:class I SAM-dependent methyltransferase [Allosphingosinicella vermicomposti]